MIYQQRFAVNFVLHVYVDTELEALRCALEQAGENISLPAELRGTEDTKQWVDISIVTSEPTLVFDICAQFGRITSAKINEL